MHRRKILAGLLLALLIPAGAAFAQPDTGNADFTRYVAFGDSLTAGFSSGSLNQKFQVNSYPALIYRQATGRTTGFEQPLISEPGQAPVLQLVSLRPLVIRPVSNQGGSLINPLGPRYNNIAVPGAKVGDVLRKTMSTSATDPTDLVLRRLGFTQLQQGLSLQPTFATLWIGNNDVLAAATSGRVIEGVTITPVAQFEADYRAIAAAIAQSGAEMAIANIPNVTSIPFVTTVPRFVVNPQTNQPVLINGQPVPLIGPNGPLQQGDFVLLTASGELALGNGLPPGIPGASGVPLSDAAVLSAAEVATIQSRVQAYNNIIRAVANERNAAFVDANALLDDLASNGLHIGGITFTSAFLTGGIFSYDGVHPTPLGYAYIANQFIEAINDKYNAEIPLVNLAPFIFGKTGNAAAGENTSLLFTKEAGRNLQLSLGVPKWVVDQQPAPAPRRPRRGNRG
ncbi:MAG TPA: SGNH/GDSL hydrolase family protein [Thermoanaerobaculia bacterium]